MQRPTLILEPNKSLAAQLASELKEMLPQNRVEFFVSYYDYYQPEAYVPRTDTFIEKDSSVNEEIDRLRHAATSSLLTHRDTIVVASVSCIYGLGSPLEYRERMLQLEVGDSFDQRALLRRLVEMQYTRNELVLDRGTFRMKGDTLEIQPAYSNEAIRVSFFENVIEEVSFFNPMTQESRGKVKEFTLFAASHYATSTATLQRACRGIEDELQAQLAKFQSEGKLLEAQRLRSRTEHDLEMLEQTGFCAGIENYSAHLDGRKPGERPYTLLDYFPEDYLLVIDESHVAVPQVRGQYAGDRSRKETLVEHGFRLPCALDNRPLNFDEFMELVPQMVFVSATPGPFEMEHSDQIVEQVIRPTGLLDPVVTVVPTKNQIDDLRARLDVVVARNERVLITTLTKRMAEDLTNFLTKAGYRVQYLHSDIDTIQRIEILRSLRLGEFDILVGHQPLARGTRPARGLPGRDPGRRQGGLLALAQRAHPDDRARGAQLQRPGDPLRRPDDRLDARRHLAHRTSPPAPDRVQQGARHRTDHGDEERRRHPRTAALRDHARTGQQGPRRVVPGGHVARRPLPRDRPGREGDAARGRRTAVRRGGRAARHPPLAPASGHLVVTR